MLPADGAGSGGTRSVPWITPAATGAGMLQSSATSALESNVLISRCRSLGCRVGVTEATSLQPRALSAAGGAPLSARPRAGQARVLARRNRCEGGLLMLRRIAPAAPALLLVMLGCAGPAKLAEKSEQRLAGGQNGRAWELAIRALDKDPGNTRARSAAAAAGNAMARDWEQRIHVLAQSDSMAAAEQVLELNTFRVNAVRYAAITVSPDWGREEQALRHGAART